MGYLELRPTGIFNPFPGDPLNGIVLVPEPGDGNQWADDSDATYARTTSPQTGGEHIEGNLPAASIPLGAAVTVSAVTRGRFILPPEILQQGQVYLAPAILDGASVVGVNIGGSTTTMSTGIGDWTSFPGGTLTDAVGSPVWGETYVQKLRVGGLQFSMIVEDTNWGVNAVPAQPEAHVDIAEVWVVIQWPGPDSVRWPLRQNQRKDSIHQRQRGAPGLQQRQRQWW